jgi:hypothetical protein
VPGFDAEAILAGALARRAGGARVVVEPGAIALAPEPRARTRYMRLAVGAALAASLLVLASGTPALRRFMGAPDASTTLTSGGACATAARHEEEGMSMKRVLKVAIIGPVVALFGGCAEDRSIGAPGVTTFDGTRMKPAVLAYERRDRVGETQSGDAWRYQLRVTRARLDGADAWVQGVDVAATSLTPRRTLDSLYYDARTMTPTRSVAADRKGGRWVWERRNGLVRLTEAPPWVAQLDMTKKGSANLRRMIEREMQEPRPTYRSPGATVGPAPLELLTPGLPLTADWRGALDVHPEPVRLAYHTDAGQYVNTFSLAVTGTRTVTTPAGTFDAWVLRGTAPDPRAKPLAVELWVDRKDGWMLRLTTTRLDEDGDPWTSETVLQRVTPLPSKN